MVEITLDTQAATELVEITREVQHVVSGSPVETGVCTVYVAHTTAGVTVNENADPDVVRDFLYAINKLVPMEDDYAHAEGNAAAHIKAVLTGTSVSIPFEEGRLLLGRWQGIFFCEYDGPRSRRVQVQVVS